MQVMSVELLKICDNIQFEKNIIDQKNNILKINYFKENFMIYEKEAELLSNGELIKIYNLRDEYSLEYINNIKEEIIKRGRIVKKNNFFQKLN